MYGLNLTEAEIYLGDIFWRVVRQEILITRQSETRLPGGHRALAALRAGEAGGLVVMKLDRLIRSVADLGRLIEGRSSAPPCSASSSKSTAARPVGAWC